MISKIFSLLFVKETPFSMFIIDLFVQPDCQLNNELYYLEYLQCVVKMVTNVNLKNKNNLLLIVLNICFVS